MNAQIISFHCVLKNRLGQVISSTYNQDVLTWDKDQQDMLVGLAKGLQNLKTGEKRKISLSADQAYGFYDPRKVVQLNKENLPDNRKARIGEKFLMKSKSGQDEVYRLIQVSGDTVTLDANHPLAGQDLIFEIEATSVRDATPEDLTDVSVNETSELLH